jgi:isopentenyl-diphosphate delta-isomerase
VSTQQRKSDHIRINLEEDVTFPHITTGLENYHFVHQALPELHLHEINVKTTVFGKILKAPILVSSMTGGTLQAELINRNLAIAAQHYGLAMGVGSQRAAIERGEISNTFRVREVAPDILLFANLGAVQFNYGYGVDQCRRAIDMIGADALILHLNPLQEAVQPEGDVDWRGLLSKIEQVCRTLSVPVIAKEVGWGISTQTARRLIEAGISAIDVAGAGGTSWSQVEKFRAPNEHLRRLAAAFADWGISTAKSLQQVQETRSILRRPDIHIFASGGIRNGQDVAKCIALGADLVGIAGPLLKCAAESAEAVYAEIALLAAELRTIMFCTSAGDLNALRLPGVLVQ